MKFLNTWEVDERRAQYVNHPVLGPATRTLANLRDAADENSDGWCYWPKPVRAAARLIELIDRDGTWQYRTDPARADATKAELRKALSPVKAFRTRSGLDFDIEEA